jgi:hypothetical protein
VSERFDYGGKRADGQYERHPELPDAEAAAKVRPVRANYKHVGPPRPTGTLRDLTEMEKRDFATEGYVAFEEYGPERAPSLGRYWTKRELDGGCGVVTRMPLHCAETYAAKPDFYGSTFCCGCGKYFPVGASGEFVWIENDGSESKERVGT